VCTYVNGRLCAKVDVSVTQPTGAKDGDGDAQVAAGSRGKGEGIEGEMGDGEGSKTKEGKAKAKRLPERLCLDPTHLALFATPESTSPNPGDDGERGLSLRYVQVSTDCWDAAEVRRQLDSLRSKDEEAALTEEVDATRFWQLSLQPLYAKPPPVWMHPAFAAEFGDAFIGGTGLESGSMQVSLEVVVLAVEQMVRATGTAARMLSHADRSALNSILAALGEAKRLAHKLAHASSSDQQRLYLSRVVASLEAQQPGEVLPIPFLVGGSATFLVVRRGVGAGSDVCTLAVVGCQAEDNVYGHRCEAVPPKIKYETCLELRGVKRTRLLDEALWVVIWFAGHGTGGDQVKLGPRQLFYQVVLSFLAEDSLEQAILKSDDLRDAAGEGDSVHFRTPRRSKSAHYGCVRHTLAYLLRSFNCSTPSCKMVSLLLRSQMLAMAAHDLQFVKHVSTAERSVLNLACRQLAYKAAKMGSRASGAASEAASTLLTADELANVRESIAALNRRLLNTPGAEPEATAPPPLILCEASAHLGRPSIATILGLNDGAELLFPKRAPSPEGDGTSSESSQSIVDVSDEAFSSSSEDPQDQPTVIGAESFAFRSGGRSKSVAAIEDAEVVGLYFSAGWCPACKTVTPMIAEAYKALTSRGKKMEICFVTLDKNEQDFNAMRTEMPWPALPFGGTRHALLASAFDVQCVPTLVLLRPNGTIISTDGIRLLRKHARTFPWLSATPPPATPHLHPLYERLLRPHQVDAGLPRELPGYAPIDFLQLPIQVHSCGCCSRRAPL
jgi:nucleoredoxin